MTIVSDTILDEVTIRDAIIHSFKNKWQHVNLFNFVFNILVAIFLTANIFNVTAISLSIISFIMIVHTNYTSLIFLKSTRIIQRGGFISD